jgi:transposase
MRPPGNPKQLERRRRRAIELLEKGLSLSAVARTVGSSVSSVFLWRTQFKTKGRPGLAPKPTPGWPPKLFGRQKAALVKLLLAGPQAAGFPTDLWTTRRIAQVIDRRFGIHYHPNHIWRPLVGLGWSCQKPQTKARERDEAAIARWKHEQWPHIKKRAKTWGPSGLPR